MLIRDVQENIASLLKDHTALEHQNHTSHLSAAFEDAVRYAETVSGLVVLPVQPEKGAYILAFRPEVAGKIA